MSNTLFWLIKSTHFLPLLSSVEEKKLLSPNWNILSRSFFFRIARKMQPYAQALLALSLSPSLPRLRKMGKHAQQVGRETAKVRNAEGNKEFTFLNFFPFSRKTVIIFGSSSSFLILLVFFTFFKWFFLPNSWAQKLFSTSSTWKNPGAAAEHSSTSTHRSNPIIFIN